jgi:DNA-binding CsgD family transcriptional regulator
LGVPDVVGREDELAAVSAFLEATDALPGGLFLAGQAGIGKTTIWRWAVVAASERSYRVLTASPRSGEAGASFAALSDLFEPELTEILSALAPPRRHALAVALRIEEAGRRRPDQLAVSLAVRDALIQLSAESPVLIAIDDGQWLDAASGRALEFAVRRLGDARVGILVSVRREGPDPSTEPLAAALGPERCRRVPVGPLSLGALHQLLLKSLGSVFVRPTLRRIHELSGGNPFYALELGHAHLTGLIRLEPGEALPPDLSALVASRIAGLSAQGRAVLAAAAAMSRPNRSTIEKALPDHDVGEALAVASRSQIVQAENDDVTFSHPLLAAAAYGSVPPSRRRELHRRLAEAIADAEERARHLALATEEPDAGVASALDAGATAALDRGATIVAAELMAHARRLTPPGAVDEARRRALMEAEYRFEAGDARIAAHILDGLIAATQPGPERAALLSRQARYTHFGEDVGAGVALLQAALAEVGDESALRVEIEEGLAWGMLLMRKDVTAAAGHARSAVRFAEQLGSPAPLAEALAAQGLTELALGLPEAEAAIERAVRLEPATRHLRILRQPSFALGYWLTCHDALGDARTVFAELRGRAIATGDDSALPPLLNHLALVELLAGNWPLAADHADEARELAVQDGQRPTEAASLSKSALIAARRGDVDTARQTASEALALAAGADFDAAEPHRALARGGELAIWALGSLALALGELDEAARYLEPLSIALLSAGIREPGELRFLGESIEALLGAGRGPDAERLLDALESSASMTGRPSARAEAARCRGLLFAARGEALRAMPEFELAATELGRTPLPFERARATLALGEAYRRNRQKRHAREALERARDGFRRLGAAVWASRAQAELQRIGGRAAQAGLTETERRIAELVATGRSNKQVAADLFITPKTVETNLTRIYAKLGVHSRVALARRLQAEGAAPGAPTSKV